MFGNGNSQDQTDAAVEGISLFSTAKAAELGTGRTARVHSLKLQLKRPDEGTRGSVTHTKPWIPREYTLQLIPKVVLCLQP